MTESERSAAIAAEKEEAAREAARSPIEETADKLFTPRVRAWAYGVIAATAPLLVTLGVMSGQVAGHIVAIAGSLLAVGGSALALKNLSK